MSDDDDKTFDPSQRRLDEARRRGDIARSTDVGTAAAFTGFLLAAVVAGPDLLKASGEAAMVFLDRPDRLSAGPSTGTAPALAAAVKAILASTVPVFLVPLVSVLLSLLAQRAFVFAPDKLAPRLSRISPLAQFTHKFGREGLFDFGKGFVKLLAVSLILGLYLASRAPDVVASLSLSPAQGTELMLQLMTGFLFIVVLLSGAISAADLLWQRAQHFRRNRMSRQEMMEEMKDSEGDPHVKGQRRQRAQEIALNRMLTDVAKADVVIINPTHYAVALRWKRSDRTAPICVAKGVDEIAARIRERAMARGVAIHSDPPTARALFAAVRIGEPIRPEHYKPVAAAIRFADALKKRRKVR